MVNTPGVSIFPAKGGEIETPNQSVNQSINQSSIFLTWANKVIARSIYTDIENEYI